MSFKPKYILAEEAEERIVALYRKEIGDAAEIFNTAIDVCQSIILDMYDNASADAEPVKHGRWEFEAKWQYKNCDGRGMERKEIFGTTKRIFNRLKCSKCKKAVVIDDTIAYAYCPNCGSKMDLEGEAHEQN